GLEGGLHRRAETWRAALLRAAALVEATIDWADEEVPEDVSPEVLTLIDEVLEEMAGEVALAAGAEKLRHGLEVALVGAPNAGKSSFLNMLAGREAAITSPEAGTTRDVVELRYDLVGLPVVFLDMAGLRVAEGDVEAEGVRRAEARARGAQLRLHLVAPDAPLPDMAEALWSAGDLRVGTKADVAQVAAVDFAVSSVTGEGIAPLMEAVSERLASVVGEGGLLGHRRARDAVEATGTALRSARANLDAAPPEVVAEDLRRALNELGRVVGRVDVEEVLGAVFSQFCLGK
ncbi:MAG: GTPase, partial [Pseudomonadota bacterium]